MAFLQMRALLLPAARMAQRHSTSSCGRTPKSSPHGLGAAADGRAGGDTAEADPLVKDVVLIVVTARAYCRQGRRYRPAATRL